MSFQYRDLAVNVVPGPQMHLDCYPDTMVRNPPAPSKKPPGPPKGPKPGKPGPGAPNPDPDGPGAPPKPAEDPQKPPKPGKPARSGRDSGRETGLELLGAQLRQALSLSP